MRRIFNSKFHSYHTKPKVAVQIVTSSGFLREWFRPTVVELLPGDQLLSMLYPARSALRTTCCHLTTIFRAWNPFRNIHLPRTFEAETHSVPVSSLSDGRQTTPLFSQASPQITATYKAARYPRHCFHMPPCPVVVTRLRHPLCGRTSSA